MPHLTPFAMPQTAPLIATSRAVAKLPGLAVLMGAPVVHRWSVQDASACAGVVAWGSKRSVMAAANYAKRNKLSLLRVEEGFICSDGLGDEDNPLSIVIDDLDIYYDAEKPSRLEALIAADLADLDKSRAQELIAAWRQARVSQYNYAREYQGDLSGRYVLVVDQHQDDRSIRCGLADEQTFQHMLAAALSDNPDCEVWILLPPKLVSGNKPGHFTAASLIKNSRIRLLSGDAHLASLLENAEVIYTVTSQLGFEGLLWEKPVRTFGMPFYAGWGLTQDELSAPVRRKPVPIENLVHAALVDYSRYIDPETGLRCDVERVIEWMALQLRMRRRFPEVIYATGFSPYKRAIVRSFFQGSQVNFVRRPDLVPDGGMLAVWGRKEYASLRDDNSIVRLEDGFVRSVGLGADLVRPLSWVMDKRGIYFDASQASDLEDILLNADFDGALLARAQSLRERLVADGLTKYNVGVSGWTRPEHRSEAGAMAGNLPARVILVPGQVESDASLAYGAPGIRRNLDLLRAVREANPDAYVIYKPHPDVVAGLRREGQGEDDAARWCDEVLLDVSMGELLLVVDEVHTLTSLAGFEALLRGKEVVCYGQPFYAGWGLTKDMLPVERRVRRLSLDQLVAGVLVLYPTYVSNVTGRFTTPERALDELLAWRARVSSAIPWWGATYRFIMKRVLRQP